MLADILLVIWSGVEFVVLFWPEICYGNFLVEVVVKSCVNKQAGS